MSLEADSLVLGDASFLSGSGGIQLSGHDDVTLSGFLGMVRRFEDGSTVEASLDRGPLWEGEEEPAPLRDSRVRDLGSVEVGFTTTDLELRGGRALTGGRAAIVGGGFGWYSDANRRSYLYGHVELPLETRVGRWISVQPNAYVEWFDRQVAAYASPARYLVLGLRAQGIWDGAAGTLRLEANPHLYDSPGEVGLGFEVEVEGSRAIGPVELLLRGFHAQQGSVYDHHGLGLGVRFPPPGA